MHHRDIFLAALDLPAPERGAFLDRACANDAELRRLVEELLLSHDEAGSFLEHPAVTEQTRTVGEGVATPEVGAATETGAAPGDDLSFLAPSPAPGCLGRLGHYEVREVVGRGGMGVVLKALDTKLQRVVAIKVLAPQLAASGTARRRFLREAHAAAAVRDDHVVGIYAVERRGARPLPGDGVHRRHHPGRPDQAGRTARRQGDPAHRHADRRGAWRRRTPRG